MRHTRLGRSGLTVSVVGLGCNNLGRPGTATLEQAGTDDVVHAALDAGITFFDVADVYGAEPGLSEERLGRALGARRDEVVIGTKFGMDMGGVAGDDGGARGSRRYIVRAVEDSLRRLGTDWIDLYQFHTPDPATPIEETLRALDDLVRAGKVRYVGHSNRAGWQIAQAEYVARELGVERFVSAQNHYTLLDRRAELEVVPAAAEFGLGVLPYFPLANGLLTGKYSQGDAPEGSRARLDPSRSQWLASADWMERNFFRRVEVAFPLKDATLKRRVIEEGLLNYLQPDTAAWKMDSNGDYHVGGELLSPEHDAQQRLLRKLTTQGS